MTLSDPLPRSLTPGLFYVTAAFVRRWLCFLSSSSALHWSIIHAGAIGVMLHLIRMDCFDHRPKALTRAWLCASPYYPHPRRMQKYKDWHIQCMSRCTHISACAYTHLYLCIIRILPAYNLHAIKRYFRYNITSFLFCLAGPLCIFGLL